MSVVNPPDVRHIAQVVDETLIITIPSRKSWFQIPFMMVWLLFWAAGWGSVVFSLFSANGFGFTPGGGFLIIWLIGWTIAGLAMLSSLLWQLTGREIVAIDNKALRIKWQLLGFSWTKAYLMIDVGDLRVSPVVYKGNGRSRQLSYWWNRNGPIAFDYGAKTYRFGDGVDEAEGKQIVKLIQKQFPQQVEVK